MAIAALGVAIDAGRRVPEELAIVAFDDIAALSDVRPQLTTIAGSSRSLGDAAAQLLLQQIEAPQRRSHQLLVLPHSLIQRSSA
jgi:DNA-binding LacI/PurR family transcriptional regulator